MTVAHLLDGGLPRIQHAVEGMLTTLREHVQPSDTQQLTIVLEHDGMMAAVVAAPGAERFDIVKDEDTGEDDIALAGIGARVLTGPGLSGRLILAHVYLEGDNASEHRILRWFLEAPGTLRDAGERRDEYGSAPTHRRAARLLGAELDTAPDLTL